MDADKKPSPKAIILQAAKDARTFTHEVEGRSFTLEMPSQHDIRIAYIRGGTQKGDPAALHVILHEVLKSAITGWSKVTVEDFMKNGDKKAVEFDRELVPELLDAQDDWRESLDDELTKRMEARAVAIGVAQKNS